MSSSYQHGHQNQSNKQQSRDESSQLTSSWLGWIFISIRNLYCIGLLTPKGIFCVIKSIYKHGANLMVLLEFASHIAPNRSTLNQQYSYQQSYELALSLAAYLNEKLQMSNDAKTSNHSRYKAKVALLCANHSSSVLALFAAARTGADITLLNTDMSHSQIEQIIEQQAYDMLICDDEFVSIVSKVSVPKSETAPIVVSTETLNQFLAANFENIKLATHQGSAKHRKNVHKIARQSSGKINMLTGGTSGRIKFAKREPSPLAMLMPFLALLNKVELAKYHSVYIAVPFYHGYGLSALIISILLSARIFISDKFNSAEASHLIYHNQIETLILVPTMLKRLLDYDKLKQHEYDQLESREAKEAIYNPTFLSVQRIISGGAKLDANLAKQTLAHTGDTLFNLYGTSESGFGVMATPADLQCYPDSIGKAIKGVRLQILPIEKTSNTASQIPSPDEAIGVLSLSTAWSMDNKAVTNTAKNLSETSYISTGDLVYRNVEGHLFLKGRADDMIVSGGENVYPLDIENALKQHPQIEQVAVIAIDSDEFGKRLVAFVSLIDNIDTSKLELSNMIGRSSLLDSSMSLNNSESITALQLMQWLKPKLARYQMPQQMMLIESLPMTKTGKVSHAKLKEWFHSKSIISVH